MTNLINAINERAKRYDGKELKSYLKELAKRYDSETNSTGTQIKEDNLKINGVTENEFYEISIQELINFKLEKGFAIKENHSIYFKNIEFLYSIVENYINSNLTLLYDSILSYSPNGFAFPKNEFFYLCINLKGKLVFVLNDLSLNSAYDKLIKNIKDNAPDLKVKELIEKNFTLSDFKELNLPLDYEVKFFKLDEVLNTDDKFKSEKIPYLFNGKGVVEFFDFNKINSEVETVTEVLKVIDRKSYMFNNFNKTKVIEELFDSEFIFREYLDNNNNVLKEYSEKYPELLYVGNKEELFIFNSTDIINEHEEEYIYGKDKVKYKPSAECIKLKSCINICY